MKGGGGDQSVGCGYDAAILLRDGSQFAPESNDVAVDVEYSVRKPLFQAEQPGPQLLFPSARIKQGDSLRQFSQSNDAQKQIIILKRQNRTSDRWKSGNGALVSPPR